MVAEEEASGNGGSSGDEGGDGEELRELKLEDGEDGKRRGSGQRRIGGGEKLLNWSRLVFDGGERRKRRSRESESEKVREGKRRRTDEMIGEGGVDRRTRRRRRLEREEKPYRSAVRYTGRYESLAKIGWFGTGQDNRCNPEWLVGTRFHRNLRRPYLLRSSLKSGNSKLYVILASCSSFLSQDLVHSLSSQSRRVSQRC